MSRRHWMMVAIAAAVFVFDQWTKVLAVTHLTPGVANAHLAETGRQVQNRADRLAALDQVGPLETVGHVYGSVRSPCSERPGLCPDVHVIEGFWVWKYVENEGAAWSMFSGWARHLRLPILIGAPFVALLFVGLYTHRLKDEQTVPIAALGLLGGGALGNLLDRLYLGYVVDFIHWYRADFHWPTFNIADVGVSTGLGLLFLSSLLDLRKRPIAAPETVARPRTDSVR